MRVSFGGGLQRGTVRWNRRWNEGVYAVSVNVNRSSSLVVSRLYGVGIVSMSFERSTTGYVSRHLSLYVNGRLVGAYFLGVWSLAASQGSYLVVSISHYLHEAANKVSLSSGSLTLLQVSTLAIYRLSIAIGQVFLLYRRVNLYLLFYLASLHDFLHAKGGYLGYVRVSVRRAGGLFSYRLTSYFHHVQIVRLYLHLPLGSQVQILGKCGYDRSIASVYANGVHVLFFRSSCLSHVLIRSDYGNYLGSYRVYSTLYVVGVVARSGRVLVGLVRVLRDGLCFGPIYFPFGVGQIVGRFFLAIRVLSGSGSSFQFIVGSILGASVSLVVGRSHRVQVRVHDLVRATLGLFHFRLHLLGSHVVQRGVCHYSHLSHLSSLEGGSVFRFSRQSSSLMPIVVGGSVPTSLRVRVDEGDVCGEKACSIGSAAYLVYEVVGLAAYVRYHVGRADHECALLVRVGQGSAAIV